MLKRKLPKDWITVNSKSHPDRVYYFNVKTNQSSWREPTLDEAAKISPVKKRKIHEKEEHRAVTPERNVEEEDMSCQQRSVNKTIETPQMKAIRAKALQRLNPGNKTSPSSPETSSTKPMRNNFGTSRIQSASGNKRRIIPARGSTSKLNDKSVNDKSRDKNDNDVAAFTPQMRALYNKIAWRNSNVSNQNKTLKEEPKDKQQNRNAANQSSKQEKYTGHREYITRNKRNNEQLKNKNVQREKQEKIIVFRKNLADERMQRIRKNFNIDKEKFKEMCQAHLIDRKASQKSNRRLPNSFNNDSLESTCAYKNVDIRLKRLHSRILKDAIYEKKVASNNDNAQNQQIDQPVIANMTEDKLIEQAKQEVLYEEMDWEPMKDEEIAQEVEVVRTQIGRENHMDETKCIPENTAELTQPNKTESHEKTPLYIVIDTNVFLSNLEIVEEARDTTFKKYPRPFIVIPWTVICELDFFKDNKSKYELSMKARKAISFIHNQFSSKHPRVIGQTREQAEKNKEDFSLNCPDDEILQCCLQIHQLQKSVVLLSYDKNLCTKAMIYNIQALERHDLLEKIDDLDTNCVVVNRLKDGPVEQSVFNEELYLSDDVFEDTKLIIKNFLSTIVIKQLAESFGEAEWKLYLDEKPPWTAVTALKSAIKHWFASVNESFQRHAEDILKELLKAFQHIPVGGRKLRDVEYILEKSSDLVQLINMDKHYNLMTRAFNDIKELKKKCTKYITDIDQKKLFEKIGIAENNQEQEMRAEKVFESFQHIYIYARDVCGLACKNVGMAPNFTFKFLDPPMSEVAVQLLQSEITKKVTDLTQNLNKLLAQAENSIKHQTLLSLQQNLNTFLPDSERITFDVAPLDVYYCVKLKGEALKTGLRQLQELTSHFCALATHT